MTDDRQHTVIVQNQNVNQNYNDGCCGGTGCGFLILLVLVFGLMQTVGEAMLGHHGLGWALLAWCVAVVVVLGLLASLDQYFNWGVIDWMNRKADEKERQRDG